MLQSSRNILHSLKNWRRWKTMDLVNFNSQIPTILERGWRERTLCACASNSTPWFPCGRRGLVYYVLLKADTTVLMSMASVSNEITFDFKKKAHQWCNQYLGGSWRNISIDDFSIQVLGYELLCYCFLWSLSFNKYQRRFVSVCIINHPIILRSLFVVEEAYIKTIDYILDHRRGIGATSWCLWRNILFKGRSLTRVKLHASLG